MNTKNTNPAAPNGLYVVAKNAQIDVRRSERDKAAGRPLGPINGLTGERGDVLSAGMPITAEDLEEGAAALAQLVARGLVVRADASPLPTTVRKPSLSVAPGYVISSARRSGIIAGTALDAAEFTKADLERLIGYGMILRDPSSEDPLAEPPPLEAA